MKLKFVLNVIYPLTYSINLCYNTFTKINKDLTMKKITPFVNPHHILKWGKQYRSIFVREIDGIEYFVMLPIDPLIETKNKEFAIVHNEYRNGIAQSIWNAEANKMSEKVFPYSEFVIGTVKELIDTSKIYQYCYAVNDLFAETQDVVV